MNQFDYAKERYAAMGVDGTYLYYIEKDFFQSIAPAP